MKKLFSLTVVLVLFAGLAMAQAPVPSVVKTFSFNLSPISLPGNRQTVVGSAAGMTLTVTDKFDLRQDDVLAPAQNFQFYGGGFNYRLPILQAKLNNLSPTLNGMRFQFYLTGSAGISRITSAAPTQHYGFFAGGGVNYDLTGSGMWTLGAEVRYAKLPGLNNNTAVVTLGPAIHF